MKPDGRHARAVARRVLAAAGLPFAGGVDPDEPARLLARLLAIAGPRLGRPSRSALPPREVAALLRAASALLDAEHRLRDAADPPPAVPVAYLDALLAWSGRAALADRRGAPARGLPFAARPLLALYSLAFGRRPSAARGGPAWRFVASAIEEAHGRAADKTIVAAVLRVDCRCTRNEIEGFLEDFETDDDRFRRIISAAMKPD